MLIDSRETVLVLFNLQLDLLPMLQGATQLLQDGCWLADFAADADIPVIILEHKKLGAVAPSLQRVARSATVLEKERFAITSEGHIDAFIRKTGRNQVVLAGAETHVCILQSALAIKRAGLLPFVVADAVSARSACDHVHALERMRCAGVELITKEMFFFEAIQYSEGANYVDLSMKYLDGRYIRTQI